MPSEIVFMVEDHPVEGYCARSLGVPIFIVGRDFAHLRRNARDAVNVYFSSAPSRPEIIRLAYYAP